MPDETTDTVDLAHHDHESGTMEDGCGRCAFIAAHPCRWCGFGQVFTTHNPLGHCENGDPVAALLHLATGDGESAWSTLFDPYLPYAPTVAPADEAES